MKQRKTAGLQLALCIDNSGYPASLELHKIYRVLPDEDAAKGGDLRVVDESGEDYLCPAQKVLVAEWPKAGSAEFRFSETLRFFARLHFARRPATMPGR